MSRKTELLLSGISFTSSHNELRLHLLSTVDGKVKYTQHDVNTLVFERYMLRHFNVHYNEQISDWIQSAALTTHRWQYLNLKHLNSFVNIEILSSYNTHHELVKDYFHGYSDNVNTLRGAI